jgi:mannose-1-phosphate guanylyltransferase
MIIKNSFKIASYLLHFKYYFVLYTCLKKIYYMKFIIQAGGNGTRLWPISRSNKPKQFVRLLDNETLFTQTVKRFQSLNNDLIILGNINHKSLIENEIKNNSFLKSAKIFFEPIAKNTAPSICSVVKYLMNNNCKDDVLVFCPSDHYIDNTDEFVKTLEVGEKFANIDKVVCFGIKPLYPETGYGYIKIGKKIDNNAFCVEKFVEKPDAKKAMEFLKCGSYLWNGGIFMAKTHILYDLFNKYQNSLLKNIELVLKNSEQIDNVIILNKEYFEKVNEISIDYAIMENLSSNDLVTIQLKLIWSDVGNYKSLFDINDKREDKNVIDGKCVLNNTKNCFIRSSKKIICCSDISDLVIVEDDDVILIMKKDESQNIKKLLEKCKESNLEKIL